jgi:hypothetical protein
MSAAQACACPQCQCQVEPNQAVQENGKYYCSKQCAQGHPDQAGCGHTGCPC